MNNSHLSHVAVYAIISLGGWLFAYMGIAGIRETRRRWKAETAVTTGKVVEHVKYQKLSRRRRRRHVYTYWRGVVEFDAEGRHYRLEGVVQHGKPAVGETVELWYDPDDPTHFHQKGDLERWFHSDCITTVIGVLWAMLSVLLTMEVFGN